MRTISFTTIFFLLLFASCISEDTFPESTETNLITRSSGDKITGQLSFNSFNLDNDWRTFSIHALMDSEGNVTGSYKRIRRLDGNANNELTGGGDVLCFDIQGNYANVILFEEIFDSTQHYFLRIYDGGNGAGMDSMTQNIPFNPDNIAIDVLCDASIDLGLMVVGEAGNIKFHE